ncbi:MAG: hypothetical protein WB053_12720 [Nitrososphaeraceae archaeon]|jgi:hypothetical protein
MTLFLQIETESTTLTSGAGSGFHVKAMPVSNDSDRSEIAVVQININNDLVVN